ncbi:MAG: outer membrane protein assembly factor BamA, partial [Alphaproteobacteria bacterium]|nr:outer membrane protein assembly factor BamA [Alphaproteobacteria bacterium]
MKHWGHKLVAFLILAMVALPSLGQAQSDGVVISGIDVVGNQRIDPETILAYTPVKIGDAVTNNDLNSTLTRLFQTNLFQDIDIALVGDRMVITVDENPI